MSSSEESVLRFVACLREARQLLHDPAVRQLLGRLDAGDLLLEAPPEPLRAPELGLEEVSTDEEDSSLWSYGTDPGIPAELSPPATPLYHSPIWDPALSAEFRVLGALLRDGPMDGGRLFRVMFDFRSSSRHIPDRLGSFVDWVVSRPRLFRCTNDGVVHAVDGAVEFLARKRDVIGYLAGCPGYKSTASALQEAIPNLGEEAWVFCTVSLAAEVEATSESILELRPFYSSREWRWDMHPPLFKTCKYHPGCSRKATCLHSHAPWRKCYKTW